MKRKTMKKAGAAVITMAMLLSIGATTLPVYAAELPTISISDITCGADTITPAGVTVYQVAKKNASTGKWAWNAPFAGVTTTTFDKLNTLDASQRNALAKSLKAVTMNPDNSVLAEVAKYTVASGTDSATLEDVEGGATIAGDGYYLIVPTVSDNTVVVQPALRQIKSTDASFSLKPKANPLPLVKKITATTPGETSQDGDSDTSVGIEGSKVSYKITSQLPEYDVNVKTEKIKPFVLTDDPSSGIVIKNDDVDTLKAADGANLKVSFGGTDVTDAVTIEPSGDGFTVTVAGTTVKANQGKNVTVTFDATVNEIAADKAVTGDAKVADADTAHQSFTGNPNTVTLTWGNNYTTGGYADPDDPDNPDKPDGPDNPPEKIKKKSTVTTYVGKVTVYKFGQADDAIIEGAEFTLTSTNTAFVPETKYVTNAEGAIDFGYLPDGTYTLTEIAAPARYKTIDGAYKFTVKNKKNTTDTEFGTFEVTEAAANTYVEMVDLSAASNDSVVKLNIADPLADTLPGTGGIGSYVFTFGGLAIVLLAGVLLVVYIRKRKTEE